MASRPIASISRTPIASSTARQVDAAVAVDLGVVADAAQEPVDDPRRRPAARRRSPPRPSSVTSMPRIRAERRTIATRSSSA